MRGGAIEPSAKSKKSLTWGQIYKGAQRLDARNDTEAYSTAVVVAMLEHVCAKKAAERAASRKPVLLMVRRASATPVVNATWARKMGRGLR